MDFQPTWIADQIEVAHGKRQRHSVRVAPDHYHCLPGQRYVEPVAITIPHPVQNAHSKIVAFVAAVSRFCGQIGETSITNYSQPALDEPNSLCLTNGDGNFLIAQFKI